MRAVPSSPFATSVVAMTSLFLGCSGNVTGAGPLSDGGKPGAFVDRDGDGLSDAEEEALGTDPTRADTDGDGLEDGQEAASGTDPTSVDSDGDGVPDGQEIIECTASTVSATRIVLPVDIIWVVDNSGSMTEEEVYVQTNINSFASSIAASGVDYHVIMIANTDHIRVPPPLGGSDRFLAVDQKVGSHDALELILSTYPRWRAFLRSASRRHFVAITDDESRLASADFVAGIAGLAEPGFPDGFLFHAIVAEAHPDVAGPCQDLSAARGQQYLDLQRATGGLFSSLCQTDWSSIFTALARAASSGIALPCEFSIPDAPVGMSLDPDRVNVVYTPRGGDPVYLPRVESATDCGPSGGWYYAGAPTRSRMITCPSSCTLLSQDGEVQVAFGCRTVIE